MLRKLEKLKSQKGLTSSVQSPLRWPLLSIEKQPKDNTGSHQNDDVLIAQEVRRIKLEGTKDQKVCKQIPAQGLEVEGHDWFQAPSK